jgi:histidyl-tRNA synthetase
LVCLAFRAWGFHIYDVLEELNLFPSDSNVSTKLLFCHFGEAELNYALPLLQQARLAGINAEIYPDTAKIKKQLDYANRKNVAYTCMIGSEEMESGILTLKNMISGEQEKLSIADIVAKLK